VSALSAVALLALTVGEPRVLAVVVGSNHSATPGRSRLAYADDDASKYDLFFRAFAAQPDITVLTELDGDSERLFGAEVTPRGPPTVERVEEALAGVAETVRGAPAGAFEIFFVFAGHGDLENGRGVLELSDGPFPAERLVAALRGLAPQRVHLVLDSCNSFFMLTPRRAGGRRYATPDDVARLFHDELPHVGVVLSTSAENEVYEWSDLQSGLFSHLIRSGGAGLADADGDGVVRYGELEAFLEVATRSIPNPAFRPKVFARSPGGRDAPLFRLRAASALRLELPATATSQRLRFRDASGLRWLDAHLEAGAHPTLALSAALVSLRGLELELEVGGERVRSRVVKRDDGPTLGLEPADGPPTSRGSSAGILALFDEPFGERALKEFEARPPTPLVFGLSRGEALRLRSVVEAFAASERDARTALIIGASGSALVVATSISLGVLREPSQSVPQVLEGGFALGLAEAVIGLELSRLADPEQLTGLAARLSTADDPGPTIAALDRTMLAIRHRDQVNRRWEVGLGLAGVSLGAIALVAGELGYVGLAPDEQTRRRDAQFATRLALGLSMIDCAAGALRALLQQRRGRFLEVWSDDPSVTLQLGVALAAGAGVVVLAGRF